MARKKKTRKIGLIGVRKDPDHKPIAKPSRRKKAPKGKPAGNRHNVEQSGKPASRGKALPQDPRTGSKKPVPLVKASETTPASQKRRYATPSEELAALEADARLIALLDKLDSGDKLTREQQHYVDEKMERHRILCELLGIDASDDDEEDTDPMASLDAISIDDYKQ
ncbi:Der GTPase-activating protein YihI [Alteromonas sp. CYL-A6]|uniref:Der GTPase-activating protein YihI n=1 Tax=Alteromonas nitratireducens TaxID=3390813 RepID=UPI0034B1C674